MTVLRLLPALRSGLALLVLLASRGAVAQEAPPRPTGAVVVSANQGDQTIHVVDAETGATLARFTGFDGPHEVAVSPDGRWAVVSDYGRQGVEGNALVVVDLETFAVARTISLGAYRRPHDLYFLPGGERLAVTSETSRAVVLVDFASGAVVGSLDTRQAGSHMMAVTPDGARIFTANISGGSVTELDVASGATVRVIPAAPFIEGIALTGDGAQLWVSGIRDGVVTVLDVASGDVVAAVPAAGFPYRVTMSPDGARAFVPGPEADVLRVFDVATREETATLDIPGGPGRVVIGPDGRTAYFPLVDAAAVGVLDLETLTVVKTLPTGGGPDGVGVSHYYVPGTSRP